MQKKKGFRIAFSILFPFALVFMILMIVFITKAGEMNRLADEGYDTDAEMIGYILGAVFTGFAMIASLWAGLIMTILYNNPKWFKTSPAPRPVQTVEIHVTPVREKPGVFLCPYCDSEVPASEAKDMICPHCGASLKEEMRK